MKQLSLLVRRLVGVCNSGYETRDGLAECADRVAARGRAQHQMAAAAQKTRTSFCGK